MYISSLWCISTLLLVLLLKFGGKDRELIFVKRKIPKANSKVRSKIIEEQESKKKEKCLSDNIKISTEKYQGNHVSGIFEIIFTAQHCTGVCYPADFFIFCQMK